MSIVQEPAMTNTPAPTVTTSSQTTTEASLTMQPYDVLDTCHQQIVVNLRKLGELVDHIDAHGIDEQAKGEAHAIFIFFMNTARQHHQDEERHVLPTMINSGDAELVDLAMRLQQDHGWIEEDWLEMAPQIEAIAAGYNWFNVDQLRLIVPVFQALCQEHMALEESLAYPEAKARTAPWLMQSMGREMSARRHAKTSVSA
jgi:hemerythrin-like domain-containing protein